MSRMDLRDYDIILVNSSAGKDSQAMLDYVAELAGLAGVSDRVVVLHNDLGRIEWPGTAELAAEQAAHYGFRFEMRRREQGLLLEQIRQRGKFPSAAARYCTSDQKRAPGRRLITELVRELGIEWTGRPARPVRPARVLYCLGIRAEESRGRAAKPRRFVDASASNGVREVTVWHPILRWTERQVWARIKASGVRYHWAYDEGMSRLSCSFCVLASKADLLCAARLRPELAREYAELEAEIGHRFKKDLSMAEVITAAGAVS